MWTSFLLLMAVLSAAPPARFSPQDQTFTVTNSGLSAYVIDGQNNPVLTLMRGNTYTFNLNANGHPFFIKTVQGAGTTNAYNSGVTGNGTQVGTLTFVVPNDAPTTLFYNCQFHGSMTNRIDIPGQAGVGGVPAARAIRVSPNPARGEVHFALGADLVGRPLEVVDFLGRIVARPGAGAAVTWDGRGTNGRTLSPGLYWARVQPATGKPVAARLLWLGR